MYNTSGGMSLPDPASGTQRQERLVAQDEPSSNPQTHRSIVSNQTTSENSSGTNIPHISHPAAARLAFMQKASIPPTLLGVPREQTEAPQGTRYRGALRTRDPDPRPLATEPGDECQGHHPGTTAASTSGY